MPNKNSLKLEQKNHRVWLTPYGNHTRQLRVERTGGMNGISSASYVLNRAEATLLRDALTRWLESN